VTEKEKGVKKKRGQSSLLTQAGTEAGCSSPKTDPSSLRSRLRSALRAPAVAALPPPSDFGATSWRGKSTRQGGFWYQLKSQKTLFYRQVAKHAKF
jgi:hypothetical protein